ncbi:hypothetical protein Pcac1_g18283 [Phytophthora cactorum]|nr:hypothetical protein Pcac1_g18283 [Phytophthora cactorum]KAG2838559.1 hypothetical protein PC111_g4211 [Phytophthora cactorum]KAG3097122.1 hypothetical protein PC122_g4679 [Phytophthora cactorum]
MKASFWSPEDRCIEDDVSDNESWDDKSVSDANDEESESDAMVATTDPILEEPNTDEADLLHLHYVRIRFGN